MTDATDKPNYKKTINRPQTDFPMKANLVQNEPASMKRWDKLDVYDKLQELREDEEPFVFHDGPPYANGSIHLGHLLNKCLKDFVVRSQSMLGKHCPFTPGWDCHGLPIEHRVMQELGEAAKDMDPVKIRQKCKNYAEKHVKIQKAQMQRLLTLADYDDPYLTMLPRYEAGAVELFAEMIEKGLVYRALKPVHWSIENQTALAEAELEYHEREDTSVYVKFDLADALIPGLGRTSLLIWTTTPWTLPANLAVAVSERAEYGVYPAGDDEYVIVACDLAAKVLPLGGVEPSEPVEVMSGEELRDRLTDIGYSHPFAKDLRYRPVVTADYVTLEDGTGLVHTAPGHGIEDYQTGIRERLDIYCPVQADGTFDTTVAGWLKGKSIWDANGEICDWLAEQGHLFHREQFPHSYPHDWRGKQPVIFRATEQWFVSVDKPMEKMQTLLQRLTLQDGSESLREAALEVTEKEVDFIPEWGRNRMRGMLEGRPDWCVSRQRSWGLPIPAFFNEKGQPLMTPESVRAVGKVFAEKGSDAWYYMSPQQLLEHYDESFDPEAPEWGEPLKHLIPELRKGEDTFDVWFESGSSWNSVLRRGWTEKQARQHKHAVPADLYLEGSDQHRGWFQHSLLPALAETGHAPFKAVLTHGFMVDKDGKKMSKSLGNTIDVEEMMQKLGADVARWWVASLNTDNDIKADWSFLNDAGEEYRKVRNTVRFMLSNLDGFDPKDRYEMTDDDAASLDAWVIGEYVSVATQVKTAYQNYQYRKATRLLFNFCNETLSAMYLAAVKDRLYCDKPDAPRRRRTRDAIYRVSSGLIRLLAPIMPHTADEAWRSLHPGDDDACVHLEKLPSCAGCAAVAVSDLWEPVMQQRDTWLRAIESYRQEHDIDNPLDLGLAADMPEAFDPVDMADLCGVSQFRPKTEGEPEVIDLRDEPRCERSWKRDGTVKQRSDGGLLSDRDADALGV